MGSFSFGGVWLTLLSEFGGRRGAAKAVGSGGMITLAGAALGPPFFGFIADATRSYTWAWLSLAFAGTLCLLLLLFLRESKRKIRASATGSASSDHTRDTMDATTRDPRDPKGIIRGWAAFLPSKDGSP